MEALSDVRGAKAKHYRYRQANVTLGSVWEGLNTLSGGVVGVNSGEVMEEINLRIASSLNVPQEGGRPCV